MAAAFENRLFRRVRNVFAVERFKNYSFGLFRLERRAPNDIHRNNRIT